MKKALEEAGKWFMNASLAILVALIIQPIAQQKFDKVVAILGTFTVTIFFFFGFFLILLSSKLNGGER